MLVEANDQQNKPLELQLPQSHPTLALSIASATPEFRFFEKCIVAIAVLIIRSYEHNRSIEHSSTRGDLEVGKAIVRKTWKNHQASLDGSTKQPCNETNIELRIGKAHGRTRCRATMRRSNDVPCIPYVPLNIVKPSGQSPRQEYRTKKGSNPSLSIYSKIKGRIKKNTVKIALRRLHVLLSTHRNTDTSRSRRAHLGNFRRQAFREICAYCFQFTKQANKATHLQTDLRSTTGNLDLFLSFASLFLDDGEPVSSWTK